MTEAPQKGENPCKSRDFEVKHMTYAPALNCIKYSVGIDPSAGFRIIIMTVANSSVKSNVLKLLPKLKTEETDGLCVA